MIDRPVPPLSGQFHGKPGNDGWGIAALVKKAENKSAVEGRTERRDSNASDGSRDARRESVIPASGSSVAVAARLKGELPKEREAIKKQLMGHPCAAGCGHVCWVANDAGWPKRVAMNPP